MHFRAPVVFAVIGGAVTPPPAAAADPPSVTSDAVEAVWIEGEAATRKSVTDHPWYGRQVKLDVMSDGAWISHYDDGKPGWAEYVFDVLTPDTYTLWVRANPLRAKLTFRIDGGADAAVDFSGDLRGQQNIAADNKPDMRFIAWIKAGTAKLDRGRHSIRFDFASDISHHGGIDCFVLTRIPFSPQGTRQPAREPESAAPDEWFPLIADDDPFSPDSVIDMSALIEAPAGKFGRVLAKGKDLVFENRPDRPIKLWGCNANLEPGKYTRDQLTKRARYLRKFGVNLVREHPLFDEVTTDGRIDPKKLDEYDWWFAELKKHGIYTQWSVFYHAPITREEAQSAGLESLFAELPPLGPGNDRRDTYGLATVEPEYVKLRLPVFRALLEHVNPHTGLAYAADPALAVVEMQNEDSVFFWNPLGALAEGKKWPLHSKRLRQRYFQWVTKQFPSRAALERWWNGLLTGDSWDAGELDIAGPWEMAAEGPRGKWSGRVRRAGDYTRFLTELQRENFQTWQKAVREAGYGGVTVTTNWLAGSAAQDPANIFTDCVGDMIDRHNYAGGGAGGHNVTEGGVYADSHLGKPGAYLFMIGLKQVEDKPFSVSEWTMGPPNQWKAECAPIMAFYGMGLQGWDASAHFAQTGWRLGDGWPGQRTYATDTPHYIGQFPALAFALHKGHIQEGPVVAARGLRADELFRGRAPLKQDYYDGEELRRVEGGVPLEVFAIGRVTIKFGGDGTNDFMTFGGKPRSVIFSATDELIWFYDWDSPKIQVRSPKTQAIIGGAGYLEMPDMTVDLNTPFVSLIFTPLDDAPLVESKTILITALARDKQSGARYNADGTRLEAVGTAPLLLEPVQATIHFKGSIPSRVRPLDCYGVPMNRTVPVKPDGRFTIDGSHRAYYYNVQR